jgi:hypothetical protein
MIHGYRQLAAEIADAVGCPLPQMLEDGSPVLADEALAEDRPIYLVGLIGGKDVGKSALVNALVGQEITARTSHGPGTEIVIAYAHEDAVAPLTALLDRHVSGRYRIVTHNVNRLRRQVLLDLPDIDSHYAAHIEVTRRMLRHMLYPLWVQSVEKYADQAPQELLSIVSAGNAPANFLFCLNKADQVVAREGEQAAEELRRDYASRLGKLFGDGESPRVWLTSAIHPELYDLPALRQMLAEQRSAKDVAESRQAAVGRQGASLAQWIRQQDLPRRLESLQRLEQSAREELAARVGVPVIEQSLPRILDDPAYRSTLADELMQQRVSRWPILGIMHVLLSPLLSLARRWLPLAQQQAMTSPADLVNLHLRALGTSGQSAGNLVQSAFASLQQSSSHISRLYAHRKLWESASAEAAEADLRSRLAAALQRQRAALAGRTRSSGPVAGFFRWLLTVGAVLWFPFIQPGLEAWLGGMHQKLQLIVQLFGVRYLLRNAGFLAVYFTVLWLALKWDTQRRIDRSLGRWRAQAGDDPNLSLTAQVVEWNESLVEPIRAARQRLESLLQRAGEIAAGVSGEDGNRMPA